MNNDPISDLIIRLKNAGNVSHESVVIPYSNLKHTIAAILLKSGYIKGYAKKKRKEGPALEIELLYVGKNPKIRGVRRVSRSSQRVYMKAADIHPVLHGYGTLILSTPKGLLTGDEAKAANVGGEALFKIW